MITICLLILAFSILKRPVGGLVRKLEAVDWKRIALTAWNKIVMYSMRGGRSATRVVLTFYYVMTEGDLSLLEKALVYAGIIYIAVPHDLLPRKLLGWLGVIDDVGVAAYLYKTIGDGITPEIELKVEETLDGWFGQEREYTFIEDDRRR